MTLPGEFLAIPLAHRALHGPGRPENSRAAIRAAMTAGFGIEIDVQLSADGHAMVFHDDMLDRLTDQTGPIRDRARAALERIVLTGGPEGIPALDNVLTLIGGAVPLLIEVKDQSGGMGPTDGVLEGAIARAIAGYGGPLAVMSFNPHSMAHLAAMAPDVVRGITTSAYDPAVWRLPAAACDNLRAIPDVARTGACFISHEAADLTRPRVADLRASGLAVLTWTIRSATAEAVARRVAQNITFEGYLPAHGAADTPAIG